MDTSYSKLKLILALFLVLSIIVIYLYPIHHNSFEEVYGEVAQEKVAKLQSFRIDNEFKNLIVDGVNWEYIAAGQGKETILFLHGMTGSADIWFNQISTLKDQYRIIAVTYPAVGSLAELDKGVQAILNFEKVETYGVVGTSLGGYFAQYLVGAYPSRIQYAVFSNTFPPNDVISEKNKTIGLLLPYLPEWLVMNVLQGSFKNSIYPTSGYDEFTLAFLTEVGGGRMSKGQVVGRYRCVVEKFNSPMPQVPVMIIEADNDPLVEPSLREQLKATYPLSEVHTFSAAGHFVYLNRPDEYTKLLVDFFEKP